MRALQRADSAGSLAGRILEAARAGDAAQLRDGLQSACRLAKSHSRPATGWGERWELLGAVATQMGEAMGSFERRTAPALDGFNVSLRLLEHLVRAG